jgi:hypothetical protein
MRVYVSGPLTKGDQMVNVHRAVKVATRLLDAGMTPYVPHVTVFWGAIDPRPYEVWMQLDLRWVDACDILVRLNGESPGADREVARAEKNGMAVWYEEKLNELIERFKAGKTVG